MTDPALHLLATRSNSAWDEFVRTGDKSYLDRHAQLEAMYDRRIEALR